MIDLRLGNRLILSDVIFKILGSVAIPKKEIRHLRSIDSAINYDVGFIFELIEVSRKDYPSFHHLISNFVSNYMILQL